MSLVEQVKDKTKAIMTKKRKNLEEVLEALDEISALFEYISNSDEMTVEERSQAFEIVTVAQDYFVDKVSKMTQEVAENPMAVKAAQRRENKPRLIDRIRQAFQGLRSPKKKESFDEKEVDEILEIREISARRLL